MINLSDKQKGMSFAFLGILLLTPDSLLIRLLSLDSWELIFYRGFVPSIFLTILLSFYYKKNFFHSILVLGFAGIFNAFLIFLGNVTFVLSIQNTNVANTLIMVSLTPFIAALLSSFFLKEHPNLRTWITILICFSFVFFIFYDSYESNRIFGDLLGIASATAVGASSVIIRYGKSNNFIPSLLIAKIFIVIFAIFLVEDIYLDKTDFYLVLLMGFFTVFLPFLLITIAPRYIPAHEVQLFFLLETVLGPIWVWLVINEQPSIKTLIGGIGIILTILIYSIVELKSKKNQ